MRDLSVDLRGNRGHYGSDSSPYCLPHEDEDEIRQIPPPNRRQDRIKALVCIRSHLVR
jgi:hypothetical protein